jgi:hypothetical protein
MLFLKESHVELSIQMLIVPRQRLDVGHDFRPHMNQDMGSLFSSSKHLLRGEFVTINIFSAKPYAPSLPGTYGKSVDMLRKLDVS